MPRFMSTFRGKARGIHTVYMPSARDANSSARATVPTKNLKISITATFRPPDSEVCSSWATSKTCLCSTTSPVRWSASSQYAYHTIPTHSLPLVRSVARNTMCASISARPCQDRPSSINGGLSATLRAPRRLADISSPTDLTRLSCRRTHHHFTCNKKTLGLISVDISPSGIRGMSVDFRITSSYGCRSGS